MIDIPIRFVKIPVTVVIIAVPDVKLAQMRIDFSRCFAGSYLSIIPAINRIDQELPDGWTS